MAKNKVKQVKKEITQTEQIDTQESKGLQEQKCPHCHVVSDNYRITNAYPFSIRYICGICEYPYIIMNEKIN